MGTRGQWAKDFANALGNSNPSPSVIKWISAWTAGEGTKAKYNPLATTINWPNSTNFNSVGVKNFATRADGINATVRTLQGKFNGYEDIREGIRTNDAERAMRGLYAAPWGTNASHVERMYRSNRDLANELLLSEEAGEGSSMPTPTPTFGVGGGSGGSWGEDNTTTNTWGTTVVGIGLGAQIAYIAIGTILFVTGIVVSVKSLVPTEQIVKTVAKAAL